MKRRGFMGTLLCKTWFTESYLIGPMIQHKLVLSSGHSRTSGMSCDRAVRPGTWMSAGRELRERPWILVLWTGGNVNVCFHTHRPTAGRCERLGISSQDKRDAQRRTCPGPVLQKRSQGRSGLSTLHNTHCYSRPGTLPHRGQRVGWGCRRLEQRQSLQREWMQSWENMWLQEKKHVLQK